MNGCGHKYRAPPTICCQWYVQLWFPIMGMKSQCHHNFPRLAGNLAMEWSPWIEFLFLYSLSFNLEFNALDECKGEAFCIPPLHCHLQRGERENSHDHNNFGSFKTTHIHFARFGNCFYNNPPIWYY